MILKLTWGEEDRSLPPPPSSLLLSCPTMCCCLSPRRSGTVLPVTGQSLLHAGTHRHELNTHSYTLMHTVTVFFLYKWWTINWFEVFGIVTINYLLTSSPQDRMWCLFVQLAYCFSVRVVCRCIFIRLSAHIHALRWLINNAEMVAQH